MKVKVKENVNEIKFPCLMKESEYGIIVLFNSNKCGICIENGTSHHEIGDYCTSWVIGLFKPFDGEITLKND